MSHLTELEKRLADEPYDTSKLYQEMDDHFWDAAMDGMRLGAAAQPTAHGQAPATFQADLAAAIAQAERDTDTDPTEDQKRAGNYRKGKFTAHGMRFTIENPKGSTRSGTGKDGKPWSVTMNHPYGYINCTESEADKDHIDVFIGPTPESEIVFVIDQVNPDGTFDEHKVVFGAVSAKEAKDIYLSNYSPGWKGFGGMKALPMEAFKEWLESPGATGRAVEPQMVMLQAVRDFMETLGASDLAEAQMLHNHLQAPALYGLDLEAFLDRLRQQNFPEARRLYDDLVRLLGRYPDLRREMSARQLSWMQD